MELGKHAPQRVALPCASSTISANWLPKTWPLLAFLVRSGSLFVLTVCRQCQPSTCIPPARQRILQ